MTVVINPAVAHVVAWIVWHATANTVAGATRYVSCTAGTLNTTERYDNRLSAPRPAILTGLQVVCNGAPGAGESFVITVRKNGATTGITCTIVDTDTYGSDTVNEAGVAVGDDITLQIVASGGAAATMVESTVGLR